MTARRFIDRSACSNKICVELREELADVVALVIGRSVDRKYDFSKQPNVWESWWQLSSSEQYRARINKCSKSKTIWTFCTHLYTMRSDRSMNSESYTYKFQHTLRTDKCAMRTWITHQCVESNFQMRMISSRNYSWCNMIRVRSSAHDVPKCVFMHMFMQF